MKYDFIEDRNKLVAERLLRCDDLGDMRIYSYTNWCKTWNDLTLNSRGIIFDRKTGKVVARPFPKFFNMNQRRDTQEWALPWHDGFRIFKKYDGWLGILYRHEGQHRIATRGSFKSTGAVWATEFLKRYDLTGLPDEVTLVFELICPATRIVVDYGDLEDLVLLAAYNRHTGEEYDWGQVEEWSREFGFTLAESYDKEWLRYCRGQIKTVSGAELEGFVIRFDNGLRVKIKSEDYFRRSDLLMNLTPLAIWNTMVDGRVPEEVWSIVDVDYHCVLDAIAAALSQQYQDVLSEVQEQFGRIGDQPDRAAFAQRAQKMFHQPAMFAMLDGQYGWLDAYVMKRIRPHKNVIEG
ncbi:MAG: hypothetical protein DRJ03_00450 [Chloroflexi bacterium]|nr:MAG: hypothetical protein DRJ03_00450 [Chloroflexota bacterium]